jgi:hypothetical protein
VLEEVVADSHCPPDVVDADAEIFKDPDPLLRTVRDCDGGSPPPSIV